MRELFTDWGGRGYDDFVPGEVTKTAPSGDRTHDPLYGRQACPEFSSSTRGLVKHVPGRSYFRAVSSQNGDKFVTSPTPPQSLNGSRVA